MGEFKVRVLRRDGAIVDQYVYETLALLAADDVLDLPDMQLHQRPAVAEFFAVIHRVVEAHAGKPVRKATDYKRALEGVPFALVPGEGEPGLLQPVVANAKAARVSFEVLGATPNATLHAVKSTMIAGPHEAGLALISNLRATYGGSGRYGAVRRKLVTVLPSDDGSFSSEVLHLSRALPITTSGGRVADHLLCALPWAEEQVDEYTPTPFLDCCAVRLKRGRDGIEAYWLKTEGPRVSAPENWIGDPHTAQAEGAGPYTMSLKRDWTPRSKHSFLFGSQKEQIDPPRILYDVGSKPIVIRVTAAFYPDATGSVLKQVYESLYSTHGGQPIERVTELSTMALAVLDTAERILRHAGTALYRERIPKAGQSRDRVMPHTAQVGREFAARLGEQTVAAVLTLLADPVAAIGEVSRLSHDLTIKAQDTFNTLAAAELRRSWSIVVHTASPLAAARASLILEARIARDLPTTSEKPMAQIDTKLVWTLLARIDRALTDADRAPIRSAGHSKQPAMAAIRILARLPSGETATSYQESVWLLVIRGLAHFRHGEGSIGRALYEAGYHEMRLERLVRAPNGAMPHLIEEAIDILAGKNTHINLTDLVALALAPEGSVLRRDIGLKIAKDFVRGEWSKQDTTVEHVA